MSWWIPGTVLRGLYCDIKRIMRSYIRILYVTGRAVWMIRKIHHRNRNMTLFHLLFGWKLGDGNSLNSLVQQPGTSIAVYSILWYSIQNKEALHRRFTWKNAMVAFDNFCYSLLYLFLFIISLCLLSIILCWYLVIHGWTNRIVSCLPVTWL